MGPNRKIALTRKLTLAGKTSAAILDAMDIAESHLRTGARNLNGHGILPDPSLIYGRLHDAKLEIDKAMAAYRDTEWPTRDDYDAAEAGR